jgi:ATP-binding cassette subfamily B protein
VLSSSIILLGLLGAIFSISPLVALISIGGFGSIYAGIIFLTRRRMAEYSRIMASQIGRINKATSEGLGGIRDVLIDGSQETYVRQFRAAVLPLHKAGAGAAFLDNSPRLGIEALGMLLIAGIAYAMAKVPDGGSSAVLVLGSLAVAAQRMLPVMQHLYTNYVKVRTSQAGVRDALELLERPLPAHRMAKVVAPLPFRQAIEVADLHFRYSASTPWVLRGINLRIPRGSRVGLIGATGSGKTTLIDLLMGLLAPVAGEFQVDGTPVGLSNLREWQARLAHVPQSIYLADVSIAENIAFGIPPDQIDFERVRQAARQAQIGATIEGWAKGYDTLVGERGVRLSGGQRQRIGIARALYKRADVIVFDEATSALDNQTESAVMEAIDGLAPDLTILIVAHRLTTLRGCDQIIELDRGGIRRVGTYADIVAPQLAYVPESGHAPVLGSATE